MSKGGDWIGTASCRANQGYCASEATVSGENWEQEVQGSLSNSPEIVNETPGVHRDQIYFGLGILELNQYLKIGKYG